MHTIPALYDIVILNGNRTRVDFVGGQDIFVITPEGGSFSFDRAELTLVAPSQRVGVASVWECAVDSNGRRM